MSDNAVNREEIFLFLKSELVGPSPAGEPISMGTQYVLPEGKDRWAPYHQAENGEEILTRDTPDQRYGVGILYPPKSPRSEEEVEVGTEVNLDGIEANQPIVETKKTKTKSSIEPEDDEDFDLALANSLKPSSMGISFLTKIDNDSHVVLAASGGRYEHIEVKISGADKPANWWRRIPVELECKIQATNLIQSNITKKIFSASTTDAGVKVQATETHPLDLRFEVVSRPYGDSQQLITVSLVNRTVESNKYRPSELILFQSHFEVRLESLDGSSFIMPYPTPESRRDEEQVETDLLYRDTPIFGTGHGCAADWTFFDDSQHRAASVSAESLPRVYLPATTPVVLSDSGQPINISMASLSEVKVGDKAWKSLEDVIQRYRNWITRKRTDLSKLNLALHQLEIGHRNLARCESSAERMEKGLRYLANNYLAMQAFQLANKAILLQQVTSSFDRRETTFDENLRRIRIHGDSFDPLKFEIPPSKGNWRPFQICFLLASIESSGNIESPHRDDVELIWFPTGGGKTEAYLGLSAFSIFLRRLRDPQDAGVEVLMRYTLRLLTTQQFERASSLVCAMDWLRSQDVDALGSQPITIGLWVGGSTTKNRKEQAIKEYDDFQRKSTSSNPYIINKCPWCGTGFDRFNSRNSAISRQTPGYRKNAGTKSIEFHCPDPKCHFHDRLPVITVDDEVYEQRPTLTIGTIDKFAQLTWVPEARALFGLNLQGEREFSPPGLIIQDELHLITGPLGSIAGLFEVVIESLCTDEKTGQRPKIISATATTRSYQEQVKALYNRDNVNLFPPAGIDASDSYFSRQDTDAPGKMYVGVHAPGFGSFQTEWVRTLAALIQSPMTLPEDERDPWWTLLMFCNSIRDMGTAHTLMDSDIRDYLSVIRARLGLESEQRRYLNPPIQELTSSLERGEIKQTMDDLSREIGDKPKPIDVCLATSIIEVGIDIPRLALMAVAGQPKTTAQYIQVTGRVGRRSDRPGLVVTLYGPSKPRDRSHFEMFRGYHERLYAQVEPSSVTPFSPPALNRALHSAMIAYIRQAGDIDDVRTPIDIPSKLTDEIMSLLENRVDDIDEAELDNLQEVFKKRMKVWHDAPPSIWSQSQDPEQSALMYYAGEHTESRDSFEVPWSTLTSMRNVDSECKAQISQHYLKTSASEDSK